MVYLVQSNSNPFSMVICTSFNGFNQRPHNCTHRFSMVSIDFKRIPHIYIDRFSMVHLVSVEFCRSVQIGFQWFSWFQSNSIDLYTSVSMVFIDMRSSVQIGFNGFNWLHMNSPILNKTILHHIVQYDATKSWTKFLPNNKKIIWIITTEATEKKYKKVYESIKLLHFPTYKKQKEKIKSILKSIS